MATESGRKCILLVNDDAEIIQGRWRPRVEHASPDSEILAAANAREATELIHDRRPHVVALDVTLPESTFDAMNECREVADLARNSSEVARYYRRYCPDGKLVVVSSYAEAPAIAAQFPSGTEFVNPYGKLGLDRLEQIIEGRPEMAPSGPTQSPGDAGEARGQVRIRSRIRAARDGLFHYDHETGR